MRFKTASDINYLLYNDLSARELEVLSIAVSALKFEPNTSVWLIVTTLIPFDEDEDWDEILEYLFKKLNGLSGDDSYAQADS